MVAEALALAVVTVALVGGLYLLFRREIQAWRLRKTPFTCMRCGRCCSFHVLLTRRDIARLETAGYSRKDFVKRRLGLAFLRKDHDGECIFLARTHPGEQPGTPPGHAESQEDNDTATIAVCRVYENRPAMCRRFPDLRLGVVCGKDPRCKAVRGRHTQPGSGPDPGRQRKGHQE